MGGIIIYMIFNDLTNYTNGLIQDCEFTLFGDNGFGQIANNTNRLNAFTGLLNRALDKVSNLIMSCDGRWQYDDTNYTDLPIGTTTLIDGQQDYGISVSHQKILRVEVLNKDGKYVKLESVDINTVEGFGMTEFMNTGGTPKFYEIQSNSLFLYPKPQVGFVTMLAGLKVFFQRSPSYFVSTDTTKTPGFATTFHRLVARWACYDYALSRQLPIVKAIRDEISVLEQELQDFYDNKNMDDSIQFRIRPMRWN